MLNVTLPTQLAGLAGGQRKHAVAATTLGEVFQELDKVAPMLRSQIFHGNGTLRQFVGLFVNDRQVPAAQEMDKQLTEGSQVLIVMSVAGG